MPRSRVPNRPSFQQWPIQQWRTAAYDFLFPPRCAVCNANGSLLCEGCRGDFVAAAPPRCPRCWAPATATVPSPRSAECDRCRLDPPQLRSLRAAFLFEGPARRALLAVKYQGLTATVPPIVELAAATPAYAGLGAD